MAKVFHFDNPVWIFLGKVADMVILTGLWLLCSLPVVTVGAATTALYTVTMQMAENREGYVITSFFRAFRLNLKQSTVLWCAAAAIGIFLAADLYAYSRMAGPVQVILLTVFGILTLLYAMTVLYLFPLLARCETDLRHLVVMAFMMALKNPGWSFFMLVIAGSVLAIGIFVMAPLLILGVGLTAYANSKILNMIFDNYLGQREA